MTITSEFPAFTAGRGRKPGRKLLSRFSLKPQFSGSFLPLRVDAWTQNPRSQTDPYRHAAICPICTVHG